MKTKNKISFALIIILGTAIILTSNCKKPEAIVDVPIYSNTIPVLTTSGVTSIGLFSATCGGNITSSGASSVIARGVCWSTSQSFTIDNCLGETTDGADVGSFISSLTGLTGNTTYYVRAYATNSSGTGYGDLKSLKTITTTFGIGYFYKGGIIFYLDGTNQHGLIAAPQDQSSSAEWGCSGTRIGCISTDIGTGQANTTMIINGCSTTYIAARICYNLVLNGYDDWFLPSKDELNQMYLQKNSIGGLTISGENVWYWSSSECSDQGGDGYAWLESFIAGDQHLGDPKNLARNVRAVRAF